jgi:hypothetical protein
MPFLMEILQSKLPDPPSQQEEDQKSESAENFRRLVAFKLQVIKVIIFYLIQKGQM